MAKVNVEGPLYDRANAAFKTAGYSSIDEFVAHCIENELLKLKTEEAESQVADQLRGLGYVE